MRISPTELMIVLVIVVLVFGPKQIPKLAKMFGKATKDIKNGMDEGTAESDAAAAKKAETTTEEAGE
ncbi:MAG: twin-arginine translocase TatA/TatE family subunit [Faecalibacterium sp.]